MTEELRAYLVARRRQLGMSQVAVARAMGTTQSALSELETGATADPGMTTIARWGAALGVEIHLEVVEPVRMRFVVPPRVEGERWPVRGPVPAARRFDGIRPADPSGSLSQLPAGVERGDGCPELSS